MAKENFADGPYRDVVIKIPAGKGRAGSSDWVIPLRQRITSGPQKSNEYREMPWVWPR